MRIVLLDATDQILLLRTRDMTNPSFGISWELPGGGVESGETDIMAALRELREETGLELGQNALSAPSWERSSAYSYRGVRRIQDEYICRARIAASAPPVRVSRTETVEYEDHFGYRWWSLPEIVASGDRFYPKRLPELLPQFLAGAPIHEPFEAWS